jgi:SAM-dependent methyltransferase
VYHHSAALYDAFYADKDYRGEADAVAAVIHEHVTDPGSLLDLGCGTGRHLEHLGRHVRHTVGLDIEPSLLAVARRRCPQARLAVGDMAALPLRARFDAVTCLFGSIAYVRTVERLHTTLRGIVRCTRPGAVVVVEPWVQPHSWPDCSVSAQVVGAPRDQSVRLVATSRRGDLAAMDVHYLFGADGEVVHRRECHELGLFGWQDYRAAFAAAGLHVQIDPVGLTGRGLIVGHREGP